jgi:hypothetical protein
MPAQLCTTSHTLPLEIQWHFDAAHHLPYTQMTRPATYDAERVLATHHRHIGTHVRDMQYFALAMLKSACDVSAATPTTPSPVRDMRCRDVLDEYAMTSMAGMRSIIQRADMDKLAAVLAHITTSLQEASQRCFCPHAIPMDDGDLVAFHAKWGEVHTAMPRSCSLAQAHVAVHMINLRDVVVYMSRHILAWRGVSNGKWNIADALHAAHYYRGLTETVSGLLQDTNEVLSTLHVRLAHE